MRALSSIARFIVAVLGPALLAGQASSCAPDEAGEPNASNQVLAREREHPSGASPDGRAGEGEDLTLAHLEARAGDPDDAWGEVSYKVKRERGRVTKELKVKIEGSRAGASMSIPVRVDGFGIGSMDIDEDGDGKLSLREDDEVFFPSGFEDPKPGTVVSIGSLMRFVLQPLEKLVYLKSEFDGQDRLAIKTTFKVEHLAGEELREFQVKVDDGPANSSFPVTIDGKAVGDLLIDFEGRGRLRYSNFERPPFPEGFPVPTEGSEVRIGELYTGRLGDEASGAD